MNVLCDGSYVDIRNRYPQKDGIVLISTVLNDTVCSISMRLLSQFAIVEVKKSQIRLQGLLLPR